MKNTLKNNPFENLVLDQEEQELENAIERGEYIEAPDMESEKNMLIDALKNHKELSQSKRITIRVKKSDLIRVRAIFDQGKLFDCGDLLLLENHYFPIHSQYL